MAAGIHPGNGVFKIVRVLINRRRSHPSWRAWKLAKMHRNRLAILFRTSS